jgi:hypothetical protein
LENVEHVTQRWDLDPADTAALWTVVFLYFGPTSIFLYANFTESMFVLLLAAFLFCVQSRWWLAAAVAAALASACRSQGALFGPVLAIAYLLRSDQNGVWRRVPTASALCAISWGGLVGYMCYLNATFQDPLAFFHAQRTWHVGIDAMHISYAMNPANAITNLFYCWFKAPMDWPRFYEALMVVLPPVVIMVLGARFLSFEMEMLAWILWGLPYISNCLAASDAANGYLHWQSMGRFMAVVLPLQIILAAVVVRFRWVAAPLLAVSAAAFALFSYLFGTGAWLG